MLAGLHSHSGVVFLGALGIFSPKALTGNFRLAKLCLQKASRALVFPPKMGQVLALPTYLNELLCDPEDIFIQSNGNIVMKDNANLKKSVAQTSFCLQ